MKNTVRRQENILVVADDLARHVQRDCVVVFRIGQKQRVVTQNIKASRNSGGGLNQVSGCVGFKNSHRSVLSLQTTTNVGGAFTCGERRQSYLGRDSLP